MMSYTGEPVGRVRRCPNRAQLPITTPPTASARCMPWSAMLDASRNTAGSQIENATKTTVFASPMARAVAADSVGRASATSRAGTARASAPRLCQPFVSNTPKMWPWLAATADCEVGKVFDGAQDEHERVVRRR